MAQNILVKSEADITDDLLFYIENEATKIIHEEKSSLDNYVDRELLNPEMMAFLDSSDFLDDNEPDMGEDTLTLSYSEERRIRLFGLGRRGRFKKLKKTIKKVFCQVARSADDDKIKEIIKKVLIGLLPIFAATGGIPALALPIIIWLVAKLVRYGIDKVCPA